MLLAAVGCTCFGVALADLEHGSESLPHTPLEITAESEQENPPLGQSQTLPPPAPGSRRPLTVVNTDHYVRRGNVNVFTGNVELEYRGYTLKADQIEGDTATDIYRLIGNASLKGEGDLVKGESLVVNFREETYTLEDAKAVIVPERTQGYTTGPFYVRGGRVSMRDPHYHLYEGELTPCDLEHPHFAFQARETEVVPGRKIVFRDFGLEIFGKRVIGLPHLYIPLLDDRPRYLPEVGQSADEGYFVKSRYVTPLRGEDTLDTRLDYMTRLGFGLGTQLGYLRSDLAGSVGVYGISGSPNSLVANWMHQQNIGRSRLGVDARFQRNNYLTAPNSSIFNGRAQFTVPSARGTTNFGFFRTSSNTANFGSVSETASIRDDRNWGPSTRTALDLTYGKSNTTSSGLTLSRNERVDVRFQGFQEMRSLSADLLYQRTVPVGGLQNFTSTSDRTPLLTLRSDTNRILGSSAGRTWPMRLEASIGELKDIGGSPITRMTFDADLARRELLSSNLSLDWNGRFRQGVYSDDTAQYLLAYGGNLRYAFRQNSALRLTYRNQKQVGFTPLSIDLFGQNDLFQFGADVDHGRGWVSTLATGYDILAFQRQQQTPWQQVTFGTTYRSRGGTYFQLAGHYDTYNQTWGTFRLNSQFQWGGTGIAASAVYDGSRSVWGGGSLQIQGFRLGQITANTILYYNGYTKRLDAQQYQISYDMHCTEAVLEITDFRSGFRSGRQIAFFIRIKALPFGSDYGFGRRGERLGGTGGMGF